MDALYEYPEAALAKVREARAWMSDPKHFKRVRVSPSATIKMLAHGQQGVDKGTAQSGKPLEVMGLLLGRPDVEDPHALVVSDALPLPAEGFETRVVVEDPAVTAYMISLMETLETTRKEHFCGWYHTHPFDLGGSSHCYMSATDVSTQLLWQVSEDPHGQPWVALVLDPLLSIAQQRPEMKAFRVYPPTYSPPAHETPDGQIVKSESQCVERWGSCWNRYYTLSVEHFMSDLARDTLSRLHHQLLWHAAIAAPAPTEEESTPSLTHTATQTQTQTQTFSRQVMSIDAAAQDASASVSGGGRSRRIYEHSAASAETDEHSGSGAEQHSGSATALQEDHACTLCGLLAKKILFCRESQRRAARETITTTMAAQGSLSANASPMDV